MPQPTTFEELFTKMEREITRIRTALAAADEREQELLGHIAALVAGDTPAIQDEGDSLNEACIYCRASGRAFTPWEHREDCVLLAARAALEGR